MVKPLFSSQHINNIIDLSHFPIFSCKITLDKIPISNVTHVVCGINAYILATINLVRFFPFVPRRFSTGKVMFTLVSVRLERGTGIS